jgi:hypothetical protein
VGSFGVPQMPVPDTRRADPWGDLRRVQTWFAASPAFLNQLEEIDPKAANDMTKGLLLSQGKEIDGHISMSQALELVLAADWVSDYHREFLRPGHWDPQLIEGTAAGLVNHSEIDARTYQVPPSDCWVIGLSSGLLPTLRFIAQAVLRPTEVSEKDGGQMIHFDISESSLAEAAHELGSCLGGILEIGYPVPTHCTKEHVGAMSLSLAVLGARFVYQHELSHLLLKHEQHPVLPDDRTFFQQAVRNHADEFAADRSALTLMALGHRASDHDLALTYAGASLFLQVLQWLDGFRDRAPDTHPTPGARLDRLRILAPDIIDRARPNAFASAQSLEDNLHRMFVRLQDRLSSDLSLLSSPVNKAMNHLSQPNETPSEEALKHFVGEVAWWLTLGNPEMVMTSLGQMKADATASSDKGSAELVAGVERFLERCGDEAAVRALNRLHSAEQYRLDRGPHPTN